MLIAARHGLAIHHITVQEIAGKIAISFDVEVDGAVGLSASRMTRRPHSNSPSAANSAPMSKSKAISNPCPSRSFAGNEVHAVGMRADRRGAEGLRERASRSSTDLHNIRVRRNEHGLFVHYHCRFPPEETVEAAHDAVDDIEHRLRERFRRSGG